MYKNKTFSSTTYEKSKVGKENARYNFYTYIPHILTTATILIGIYQYKKTTEKEIRKEFFNKQIDYYEKLSNRVTTLVYPKPSFNRKDSLFSLLDDYKSFRRGPYTLYTTDSVEKYAGAFEFYYERYLQHDPSISKKNLEVILFRLTNQCRLSLDQTLDVNLKQLTFRTTLNQ